MSHFSPIAFHHNNQRLSLLPTFSSTPTTFSLSSYLNILFMCGIEENNMMSKNVKNKIKAKGI